MNISFSFVQGNFRYSGTGWGCKPDFTNGEQGSFQMERLQIERLHQGNLQHNLLEFSVLQINMLEEAGFDIAWIEDAAYKSWAENGYE